MRMEGRLYDGTHRPGWAGPVSVISRRRPTRGGRPSQSVEVAGVVLPVEVPGRFRRGAGAHAHTGGVGLGFPDLTDHILQHPAFAKHWSAMENTISAAAMQVMGWNSRSHPRNAARSAPPPNALRLLLSGIHPGAGEEDDFNPDEHPLSGELQKVYPIWDLRGRNVRMQSVGSPATFRVGASSANFSRDPRQL